MPKASRSGRGTAGTREDPAAPTRTRTPNLQPYEGGFSPISAAQFNDDGTPLMQPLAPMPPLESYPMRRIPPATRAGDEPTLFPIPPDEIERAGIPRPGAEEYQDPAALPPARGLFGRPGSRPAFGPSSARSQQGAVERTAAKQKVKRRLTEAGE